MSLPYFQHSNCCTFTSMLARPHCSPPLLALQGKAQATHEQHGGSRSTAGSALRRRETKRLWQAAAGKLHKWAPTVQVRLSFVCECAVKGRLCPRHCSALRCTKTSACGRQLPGSFTSGQCRLPTRQPQPGLPAAPHHPAPSIPPYPSLPVHQLKDCSLKGAFIDVQA